MIANPISMYNHKHMTFSKTPIYSKKRYFKFLNEIKNGNYIKYEISNNKTKFC